jgi:hypothetical protein
MVERRVMLTRVIFAISVALRPVRHDSDSSGGQPRRGSDFTELSPDLGPGIAGVVADVYLSE